MNTNKGFAAISVVIALAIAAVIGGGAYVAMNPEVIKAPAEETQDEAGRTDVNAKAEIKSGADISWDFIDAGEKDGIPYTRVMLNGHHVGDYQGSCYEVTANGGVDDKSLLTGQISAAQCWFAGGGDEIGVFGNEDGGVDVMVGALEEPIEGSAGFRGDFELRTDIDLD